MKYQANPVIVDALKIIKADRSPLNKGAYVLTLEDGELFSATPEMTARMEPVPGDYVVTQADGYTYLNPKDVFLRKYKPLTFLHEKDTAFTFDNYQKATETNGRWLTISYLHGQSVSLTIEDAVVLMKEINIRTSTKRLHRDGWNECVDKLTQMARARDCMLTVREIEALRITENPAEAPKDGL